MTEYSSAQGRQFIDQMMVCLRNEQSFTGWQEFRKDGRVVPPVDRLVTPPLNHRGLDLRQRRMPFDPGNPAPQRRYPARTQYLALQLIVILDEIHELVVSTAATLCAWPGGKPG